MGPYVLNVFHKGNPAPTETRYAKRAQEVLEQIELLLEKHRDCHRLSVHSLTAHLFTVDCNGETVEP